MAAAKKKQTVNDTCIITAEDGTVHILHPGDEVPEGVTITNADLLAE